jgi:hypothetical protein
MSAKDYGGIYAGSSKVLRREAGAARFEEVLRNVEKTFGGCTEASFHSADVQLYFSETIVNLTYRIKCEKGERLDRFSWQVSGQRCLLNGFVTDPISK